MTRFGRSVHNLHFLPSFMPGVHALLERKKFDDVKIYRTPERTLSGFYVYTAHFGHKMGRKKVMRKSDLKMIEWLEERLDIIIKIVGDDEYIDGAFRQHHIENIVHLHGMGMTTEEIADSMECSRISVLRTLQAKNLTPNLPLFGGNQHGRYTRRAA